MIYIIFLTPPQNNFEKLDWNSLSLKLAVRRIEDNHISKKKFIFQYFPHNITNCMFCFHNLDTDEKVNIDQAKKRIKKSLNMTNYATIEMTQDVDKSFLQVEGLSGYISSPEHILSPPMFKKMKQHTSEVLIPTTIAELFNPPTYFTSTSTASLQEGPKMVTGNLIINLLT